MIFCSVRNELYCSNHLTTLRASTVSTEISCLASTSTSLILVSSTGLRLGHATLGLANQVGPVHHSFIRRRFMVVVPLDATSAGFSVPGQWRMSSGLKTSLIFTTRLCTKVFHRPASPTIQYRATVESVQAVNWHWCPWNAFLA